MHRGAVLTAIIAIGVVSMAATAVRARQRGATQAALNATKIEKVKDNLYVITGSGMEIPTPSAVGTPRCS